MTTTISNSSSHLLFSRFWEKMNIPLQLFSWVEKSCCGSIHGENSLLFWVEGITVLSCLPFLLMVSVILDWKHLDCYFFPGSNLDIHSFLSTEGKNLASSREWWRLGDCSRAFLELATCLKIREECTVAAGWYQTNPLSLWKSIQS